jgi:inosine-uridine nucleoside N-ribohydrolase
MRRIIIDTDPGIDDAHAILLSFAHPNANIEALTTAAGNVTLVELGMLSNIALATWKKIDSWE